MSQRLQISSLECKQSSRPAWLGPSSGTLGENMGPFWGQQGHLLWEASPQLSEHLDWFSGL
jgi:hypothetical protein